MKYENLQLWGVLIPLFLGLGFELSVFAGTEAVNMS